MGDSLGFTIFLKIKDISIAKIIPVKYIKNIMIAFFSGKNAFKNTK